MHQHSSNSPKQTPKMPLGGFLIDAQGREIPITETMIQQACNALEKTLQPAPKSK